MSLRNLFASKATKRRSAASALQASSGPGSAPPPPLVFVRSDTSSRSIIHPPSFDDGAGSEPASSAAALPKRHERSRSFRESFLGHRRKKSAPSIPIAQHDLPTKVNDGTPDTEAQWEDQAIALVSPGLAPPAEGNSTGGRGYSSGGSADGGPRRSVSASSTPGDDRLTDDSIQLAIKLHESGQLERSTRIFGRLADPNGANNPLAQVLYGLALRHGWGIEVDLPKALTYLQAAARNSAAVEQEALQAGMKKGGKSKGELVLAIYELGNCFRNGWGVGKDPVAAREYYETAANLGDSDAQNEVGWCYVEGFGCKKDKKKAAKYYRLAEKQGNKTLGNSWIYKEKYMDGD